MRANQNMPCRYQPLASTASGIAPAGSNTGVWPGPGRWQHSRLDGLTHRRVGAGGVRYRPHSNQPNMEETTLKTHVFLLRSNSQNLYDLLRTNIIILIVKAGLNTFLKNRNITFFGNRNKGIFAFLTISQINLQAHIYQCSTSSRSIPMYRIHREECV
jgi:hypothetical protein